MGRSLRISNLMKRRKLDESLASGDLYIRGMPDAEIISPGGNFECSDFALGKDTDPGIIFPAMFSYGNDPVHGDIVAYYSDSLGTYTHLGVWQENGKVLSKFGERGPIVIHNIDLVPEVYGNRVFFSRETGKIVFGLIIRYKYPVFVFLFKVYFRTFTFF